MSINDIPLGRLKEILASDVPLTIVTTEALIARLEQAEAAVARVQEMHQQSVIHYAGHGYGCTGCMGTTYPCPTIRATIKGGEQE